MKINFGYTVKDNTEEDAAHSFFKKGGALGYG
jgi:hypothetical protein